MYRTTKLLVFILVTTMLCTLFSACKEPEGVEQTTAPETEQPPVSLEIIKDGNTDFVLCRPDETTNKIIEAGQKLIASVKSYTGADISYKSDWLKPGEESPTEKLEILLGNTNRPQTQQILQTLKYNDYFIGVVDNKLVIVGGNESATVSAVDYFIKNFIKEQNQATNEGGNLVLTSEQNYLYSYNYRIKTLSFMDKSIAEYSLIVPKNPSISEYRFAVEFREYISRYTGYVLSIQNDEGATTEYEILIGNTSRTTLSVSDNQYKINLDGTKVQILAENLFAYDLAYLKIRDMIPYSQADISLTSSESVTETDTTNNRIQRSGDIRIIINNVLGNSDQSLYPITQRSQMLAELYKEYDPDVLGFQEFSNNSRNSKTGIVHLLPEFTEVKVTVNNSDGINYTPLFYRADRLTLVEAGYHVYKDGMNDRSKSITWAVFDVKATGKRFAVCSTHFYWTSDANAARLLDAQQLLDVISSINTKYNCPVFSGGDYNCNPSSEPYKKLTAGGCVDIQSIAPKTSNYKTAHAYPEFNVELGIYDNYTDITNSAYTSSIDHIFLGGNKTAAAVKEFRIINDKYALLGTDHTPLLADFNLN